MSAPAPVGFLDSSVIVRYLTNDPPAMAETAAEIIDTGRPLIVSEVVLAESAYVLSSVYGVPRAAVVDALSAFVQRHNIRLLNLPKPLTLEALSLCRDSGRHSFTDALLWAEARNSATPVVYTFDARFPATGVDLPLARS